jgi:hypothetical protein
VRIAGHSTPGLWADAQDWDIFVDTCSFASNGTAFWSEINTLNFQAVDNACYNNRHAGVILDAESIRLEGNRIKQADVASYRGMFCSARTVRTEQKHIPDIDAGKNAVLRNNIVAASGTSGNLHHFDNFTMIPSTMLSEGNTYYAPYTANLFNIADTPVSFADWHDNYLFDATSQLLPPGSPPLVNDGSVTVGFESDWGLAPEARSALRVPIVLSKAVDDTISVDLSVESLSATEGSDFRVVPSGRITFKPLETSVVVNVIVPRDSQTEGEEFLRLILSNPSNASLGAETTFTVRIPANGL